MGKTVVIQPGGYHPFHAGHYALYQNILNTFPGADVYVAATNDTSNRPFPFEIKKRLANIAGVKNSQFVQVKNPFQPTEILKNYNPEEDVVIFVRSEKDKNSNPKPGLTKKDGSPAYFQLYTGKNLQPFGKHGYIYYLPTVEFGPGIKSASEIRNIWPKLNTKRKLAMVMSLYPKTRENQKLAQNIVKMLDLGINGKEIPESYNFNSMKNKISKKYVIETFKDNYKNADVHDILAYAKRHYPEQEDLQDAFVKFVLRSLKHSKEDSEEQAKKIKKLEKEIDQIKSIVDKFEKVNEGNDYIQEK
jgi:hypothetical protein